MAQLQALAIDLSRSNESPSRWPVSAYCLEQMGYADRDYYRDSTGSGWSSVWQWFISGRVRLFEAFGITVYAHSSLIIVAALMLLLGTGLGGSLQGHIAAATALFGIVLLHEFGHCFAARWTGGEAHEIVMHPLGGLAYTMSRRRPIPTFITVAGGPAVNVLICIVAAIVVYMMAGVLPPLNPWGFGKLEIYLGGTISIWSYHVFAISYFLLLFNLLPIFPLDGGQMLQAGLWQFQGWYKATLWTVTFGIGGAILMALVGLATGALLMVFIALLFCLPNCWRMRKLLLAEGPWAFQEEDEPDYAASLRPDPPPSWLERRAAAKEDKREAVASARRRNDEQRLDQILAKISASGRESLSRSEQSFLDKTSAARRRGG